MKKKRLQKSIHRLFESVHNRFVGTSLAQKEFKASKGLLDGSKAPAVLRQMAADGCVLLKNENGVLPLKKDRTVSVFGRCQRDWFFVGYGSGGNVNAPRRVSLMDALENDADITINKELAEVYKKWCAREENVPDNGYWGHWPMNYDEMPLNSALAESAAAVSDTALVVIGRAAGEERENTLTKGSYYLTDVETEMLDAVTSAFEKVVVVINSGNVIDMAWTEKYGDKLSAILLAWQGGMESGNAAADILSGRVNPSGRLADSIAASYADYPSAESFGGREYNDYAEDVFVGYRYFTTFSDRKTLYPFGFGLSYTTFAYDEMSLERTEAGFTAGVRVTNTGAVPGRNTVQIYMNAPQGSLVKPGRSLAAFGKSRLLAPNESEQLTFEISDEYISSFDDSGASGFGGSYILEAGEYRFYTGESCEENILVGSFTLPETRVMRSVERLFAMPDDSRFERISGVGEEGKPVYLLLPKAENSIKERILAELPQEIKPTGDKGIMLADVAAGKNSLNEFIAQLSDKELEGLSRGEGLMSSKQGTEGNAGVFGGVLPSLRKKGIPPVITADGPAGLRICRYASLMPCGAAVACAWDTELVGRMYAEIADEMKLYGIDMILSPGLNIHRNPLCGRNFEYFSEDPLLSGTVAAAAVRGLQSGGGSACPKHFACNNQELCRNTCDSRVSERALREIYLRNFEICVKEGSPKSIMTSYNKVNGVWSHYNYDLAASILRGEWGFDGVVITDWWMRKDVSHEFPKLRDNAYRVRARVDVLMPGSMKPTERRYKSDGSLLETLGREGGITRAELQQNAAAVLRFCIDMPKMNDK